MKKLLTLLLSVAVPAMLHAQAAPPAGPSAAPNQSAPILVELFTSEGCSDCPAADRLLREISATRTASGRLIIALSEHVTYWNRLGWTDPFSDAMYTARQEAYGTRFHLDSVYTPQMIVNGSAQLVGSDRAALTRALDAESAQHSPVSLHIDTAGVTGNVLKLTFTTNGSLPGGGAEILAAVTEDTAESNVLRGENSGRRLQHVAVARALLHVATLRSVGPQAVELRLPAAAVSTVPRHLTVFVQSSRNTAVLAADTRPL